MKTPTSRQLRNALHDVRYEIESLLHANRKLARDNRDNDAIELCLLHLRNLWIFFARSVRQQNDVLATDFGFKAKAIPYYHRYRVSVNKRLAHITYTRTQRKLEWPLGEMNDAALDRAGDFADHVLRSGLLRGIELDSWKLLKGTLVLRPSLEGISGATSTRSVTTGKSVLHGSWSRPEGD